MEGKKDKTEDTMETFSHPVEQYSRSLDQLILPGTLMDCLEAHRAEEARKAALPFTDAALSHFLHMMNELRGVADMKDDLNLLFDPFMYTNDHPAWTAPPGTLIKLPALNTQVLTTVQEESDFSRLAEDEVTRLRRLSDTYPDDAMIGFAKIAAADYVDQAAHLADRGAAIRYLAINASARLEDCWAADQSLWLKAGTRTVHLAEVVAEMKSKLLDERKLFCESPLTNEDLTCYTEERVKQYVFHPDKFLLSGNTKHMALCGFCQERIAAWVEKLRRTEEQLRSQRGGFLPRA